MKIVKVKHIALEVNGRLVESNSRLVKALEMACDYFGIPAQEFNLKYKDILDKHGWSDNPESIMREIAECFDPLDMTDMAFDPMEHMHDYSVKYNGMPSGDISTDEYNFKFDGLGVTAISKSDIEILKAAKEVARLTKLVKENDKEIVQYENAFNAAKRILEKSELDVERQREEIAYRKENDRELTKELRRQIDIMVSTGNGEE